MLGLHLFKPKQKLNTFNLDFSPLSNRHSPGFIALVVTEKLTGVAQLSVKGEGASHLTAVPPALSSALPSARKAAPGYKPAERAANTQCQRDALFNFSLLHRAE